MTPCTQLEFGDEPVAVPFRSAGEVYLTKRLQECKDKAAFYKKKCAKRFDTAFVLGLLTGAFLGALVTATFVVTSVP